MGWWACSIMGGDQPLDFLDNFARLTNARFLYKENQKPKGIEFFGYDFKIENVKLNKAELERSCQEDTQLQVLGVLFMALGVSVPQRLRNKILAALDQDEEWGKHSERKLYIQEYRKKLMAYDNKTPTHLTESGLLKKRKRKNK